MTLHTKPRAAWHGNQLRKDSFIAAARQDAAEGRPIFADRGGAFYEHQAGLPRQVINIAEAILAPLDAGDPGSGEVFAQAFLDAIPLDADLATLPVNLIRWLLANPIYGVIDRVGTAGKDTLSRVARGVRVGGRAWSVIRHEAHAYALGHVSLDHSSHGLAAIDYAARPDPIEVMDHAAACYAHAATVAGHAGGHEYHRAAYYRRIAITLLRLAAEAPIRERLSA